jgi:hypothetical protein
MKKIAVYALFFLAQWTEFSACANALREKMDSPLTLEISVRNPPAKLGVPCTIDVVLRNSGQDPVAINPRLAVGYRDGLDREIFADLTDAATGRRAGYYEADINRMFAPPIRFTALLPGDSVNTSFDLFEYYNPGKPAKYRLTVFYQADAPGTELPPDALRGTFTSNTVDLEILPPF